MNDGIDEETLKRLQHDVRSPLVVISGFAQLLSTDSDLSHDDRREYAGRIEEAARDLTRLIDEILG